MTQHTPQTGDGAATTPDEPTATDVPAVDPVDDHVMELLHERVPLSLLVDLAEPGDPDSRAILEQEGEPEGQWWEPGPS